MYIYMVYKKTTLLKLLWSSLLSGSLLNVSSHSSCVTNDIKFLTYSGDSSPKTQNSSASILEIIDNTLHGKLEKIIKFSYLNSFEYYYLDAIALIPRQRRKDSKMRITSQVSTQVYIYIYIVKFK